MTAPLLFVFLDKDTGGGMFWAALNYRCDFISAEGLVTLNICFQENANIKNYSELECNIKT